MRDASGWLSRLISPRLMMAVLAWGSVIALTIDPAPLEPVAQLYHELCAVVPPLTIIGQHIPPLALALMLVLLGAMGMVGVMAGIWEWHRTHQVATRMLGIAQPVPPRVARVSQTLDLNGRMTYLATPAPVALCYGLLYPRIAVSAGMLTRLNDAELTAVLLHERHHLRQRDPLRYLLLHAVTCGLFLVPLAPVWQQWLETQMELDADRAALAMLPRGALAGALAAVLIASPARPAGIAALSATEARIASLVGMPQRAPMPIVASLISLGLLAGLTLALAWLGNPHQVWEVICTLCPGLDA